MKIDWREGRWVPTFVKGGAMGIVDGAPVYAVGCTFPWRETEQSWYWDAARNDWFPVEPSLPLGRCYAHGATIEDGLLVVGGRKTTMEGRLSLRDVWLLRRSNGEFAWTRLPDLNQPRAIPCIGVWGRKVLVFGGGEWEKSQGGAFATRHLTNYEILDLDNLAAGWRDLGPLPFPSFVGAAFATVGDSTYAFGGYECWTEQTPAGGRRAIRRLATVWRYDYPTDRWTRLRDLPFAGSGWCAAAYRDTILLLGGGIHLAAGGVEATYTTHLYVEKGTTRQRLVSAYSDLVFAYDPAADRCEPLADRLPVGNNDVRCAISGDTLYVAGGENVDPALSNCSNAFLIGEIA